MSFKLNIGFSSNYTFSLCVEINVTKAIKCRWKLITTFDDLKKTFHGKMVLEAKYLKLPLTKPLRFPSISVIRTGGALFRLLFFLLELHDCSAWCHLHSFIPQVLSQTIQETAAWKIFFHTSIQIRAVKIVISSDTFNLLTKTAQEHKHEIIVAWKPT